MNTFVSTEKMDSIKINVSQGKNKSTLYVYGSRTFEGAVAEIHAAFGQPVDAPTRMAERLKAYTGKKRGRPAKAKTWDTRQQEAESTNLAMADSR